MNARVGSASSWWTGRSGGGACTTHRQGATAVPSRPGTQRPPCESRADAAGGGPPALRHPRPPRGSADRARAGLAVRPLVTGLTGPRASRSSARTTSWSWRRHRPGEAGRSTAWSGPCSIWRSTRLGARAAGIALHPTSRPTRASTCTGRRAAPVPTATSLGRCRCSATGSTASSGTATTLTFDRTSSAALVPDRQRRRCPATRDEPRARGNHNGGVIRFGPDGKLYIIIGDNGRRGWMQNLPTARSATARSSDDQFGGPAPDDAHLSGVILRLNADGSAPATTRSSPPAQRSAARSGRTSRRSSPTGTATASAWRSTPSAATCGSRRTATTRSTS